MSKEKSVLHPTLAILIFLLASIYLSTLQVINNGSKHPYATDVGEIQNALPRWGTLHFSGYPQYTFLGSIWTEILSWLTIKPAIATSLFSLMWGLIAIGLLFFLLRELHISKLYASLVSLLFGLSTSMWVDSSIAEIHTMTIAITIALIWVAFRFARYGQTSDFYWLVFLTSHGIVHIRSIAFIGLGIIWLTLPQWKTMLKHWRGATLLFLSGWLTYLYLPIRDWMGADWLFSNPGTWQGFKALVLDTKADRIVQYPTDLIGWLDRASSIWHLLTADWPTLLLVLGMLGLLIGSKQLKRREKIALHLIWLPIFLLSLIIWEGYVSDALLAVKIPIVLIFAIGLALLVDYLASLKSHQAWQQGLTVILGVVAIFLYIDHRQTVLDITRDESAGIIAQNLSLISPDERPTTIMGLHGNGFWEMAYATAFDLEMDVNVVDHNANFAEILKRGDRLITLSNTFYSWPLNTWEKRAGQPIYLQSAAPEMIVLETQPLIAPNQDIQFDLANGVAIRSTEILTLPEKNTILLHMDWQALQNNLADYSVAVQVLLNETPTGPQDIVAQADRNHPVHGWYPTSLWQKNQIVTDHYEIVLPANNDAPFLRVGMYQIVDGSFVNSDWLVLPLDEIVKPNNP